MRKASLAGVLVAAACGGRPARPAAPPPSPTTVPAPAPPRVTSDPDIPTGADAARDAELAAGVKPFLEAFTNRNGSLTRDGKHVIFESNRDGIAQLYIADAARPDAPARRLVATPERVRLHAVSFDGKYVVFRTDHGADENWTLWRVDVDGANLTELTPGETLHRDPPHLAERVPGTVYYSARKREEAATAIYALDIAGGKPPRRLHASDGFGFLFDVARDGKTLAYLRFPSEGENYIDLVDATTGRARVLYPRPGGGPATIEDARFSGDGKRVFVVTDTGAEKDVLLALDARTGKELARYQDPASATASLSICVLPRRRTRLACRVSLGDHDEVRVLDAATLKPVTQVKLPLGSGRPTWFSDDARTIVVQWSTPNAPTDLLAVDARSGRVAPLRNEPRPSLGELPPLTVTAAEVVAHDGLKIPVHAYLPPGAGAGHRVPVIVEYHGGPPGVSRIRWAPLTRFFLSLGYAWVEPNVRGSWGYGRSYAMADDGPRRLDALKDVESTGRWVAAQPWADPHRLVIYGRSYGGYTTLAGLTRSPDLWRAGVDLYGVVNWLTFMKTTNGLIRQVFLTEIGDPDKDRALLESLSPIHDVDRIRAPLFVYAGANDPRVPKSEDDQIVKALRARGIPVEYMVAPNEGHSLSRRENQIAFAARAARFLEQALK